MSITRLPRELVEEILAVAAEMSIRDGPTYTFGLTTKALTLPSYERYVRGPVPPDLLKWDATSAIRIVCWAWHEWAMIYCVHDLYLRKPNGEEVNQYASNIGSIDTNFV